MEFTSNYNNATSLLKTIQKLTQTSRDFERVVEHTDDIVG
jgi:hypothetical protein